MSRKKTTGDRYRLGEPYAGMLADFCAANFGAPEIEVIRQAVQTFIDSEVGENPGVRERYLAAREKRLSAPTKIHVVKDKG